MISGEKNISKAAFQVLDLLMDVFNSPELWFGILPSATTELSAYLTQIGDFRFPFWRQR